MPETKPITRTERVRLHWRDGSTEEGEGTGEYREEIAADAMNKMGIGAGALPALDYWEILNDKKKTQGER